ncbi:MAG: thioredoxin domain-containing protein, partial [Proteobacteria bacterium]|nr:thioredoxin domain-containing protein [Pseudomonadota bacterium]
KVDREERPDIDDVCMTIRHMLTGSGGWPLSIVMTPDKKPFFAATYIPKETRFGRIGMLELIPRIKDVWENRIDEVLASANQITTSLQGIASNAPSQDLNPSLLDQTYELLASRFDEKYGGFGSAPKFPTPHNLLFLLRYWKRTQKSQSLEMVERTLQQMKLGGIYDHVGFGFHRYSTDQEWLVPHFEKMLYDQAMLAIAYTEAYQATGKEEYAATTRE